MSCVSSLDRRLIRFHDGKKLEPQQNLKDYNQRFYRIISNDHEKYNINIISDKAKLVEDNQSIEFTSNNKQVETTINFLNTK